MSSAISRRGFLGSTAATGLGIAFAGSIDAIAGTAANAATRTSAGYGPLVPDPAGLLSLPAGFSYRVVAQAGVTPMDGGGLTPSDMDGMGIFSRGTGLTLVINHEIADTEPQYVPHVEGLIYDPGVRGGTTNLELDADGNRVREYVSVSGTENNCAGGVTPWQTWLTCEETERLAGSLGRTKDHGYVFEVSPIQAENHGKSNVPLKFLGRFAHEAAVVDPATNMIYMTEDAAAPNGLFYRWTPPAGFCGGKGALLALADAAGGETAGALQAMRCVKGGRHIPDLSLATQIGTEYKVTWVDVPDRDGIPTSVRKQFTTDQITRGRKIEGAWFGHGGVYFVTSFARTSDGSVNEHDGQVWFYNPKSSTVTLKTIFGVNANPDVDANNYDGPDNITVNPYGGVILAEDGNGIQYLIGVTDKGAAFTFAKNQSNNSEFCGPVFSPDSKTMFVNIYDTPGYVLAVTGPWGKPAS